VLFVGRVAASKGADVLAEAALCAARDVPGLRVRFAGRAEGDLPERLCRRAKAGGAPGLFEFVGHVPRERLPAEMAGAHVFAAPSPFEAGPGLVYLEAMACGLPVVACALEGLAETVEDGRTGLLVPVGDTAATADALVRLLREESLRRELGAAARREVLEHADARRCVERIAGYFERVAGGPAR
jgi:glycosyltransferase involved in cell wall biosynthesis